MSRFIIMQTILFASRKGGSGKTTLLAHMAVQALQAGEDVTVVDLDPQQNLAGWWEARPQDKLQLAKFPVTEFRARLEAVKHKPGLLFIDTPGFEAAEMQPLLDSVDFIVIPVQPTPNDLRAIGQTVQAVKRAGKDNFCFVVTRGIQNTKLTLQTPLVLSQHGPVATTVVFNRVDYAGAMADGRTIQEIDPKGKGAEETAQLWAYVRQRMIGHPAVQETQKEQAHV
jgi:chromosome partitioning protein